MGNESSSGSGGGTYHNYEASPSGGSSGRTTGSKSGSTNNGPQCTLSGYAEQCVNGANNGMIAGGTVAGY